MKIFLRSAVAAALLALSAGARAGVFVSVTIAPPALPVYEQPPCPDEGYIWTPGYWAYDNDYQDYYWVPGTWVLAPQPGYLWTPGWWGWENAVYIWHSGYWGPHVGFYGGINYGYGYVGDGYYGGRWDRGRFQYNTAVNNVNVTNIHNTYNSTVINNVTVNRVSYNGGSGGIDRRPGAAEREAAHEHHFEATHLQAENEHAAHADRAQFVSANHGRPNVAATPRPGIFSDRNVMHAKPAGDDNFQRQRENNDRENNAHLNQHSPLSSVQPAPHQPEHQAPDASAAQRFRRRDLSPNPNPVIPDESPHFERQGPRSQERVLPATPTEHHTPPREHIERAPPIQRDVQPPREQRIEAPMSHAPPPQQLERAAPPHAPAQQRGPEPGPRPHAGRHDERDEGRR